MFLIFYVAGLGALFVVMGCEPPGVRRTMLPDPLPELSAHELAYLHGGEHRVADTELAVLHRQRKLVVTRDLLLGRGWPDRWRVVGPGRDSVQCVAGRLPEETSAAR